MKLFLALILSITVLGFNCPDGFMCGEGCGLHPSEADKSARVQIAKTFKVKIDSKFVTVRSSFGDMDDSFIHESISEFVVNEIEGVTIKKREESSDGEYCAQALLNKSLFSERMRNKINLLKNNNKTLKNKKHKLVLEKIRSNNKEIRKITELLSIVDPSVLNINLDLPKIKDEPIVLVFKMNEELNSFENLIRSRILRNGFSLAEKSSKVISITLSLKKSTLNIEGFEKLELVYKVTSQKFGKQVGQSYGSILKHGRTKSKIIEKLYKGFKKLIPQIFIDLKL